MFRPVRTQNHTLHSSLGGFRQAVFLGVEPAALVTSDKWDLRTLPAVPVQHAPSLGITWRQVVALRLAALPILPFLVAHRPASACRPVDEPNYEREGEVGDPHLFARPPPDVECA